MKIKLFFNKKIYENVVLIFLICISMSIIGCETKETISQDAIMVGAGAGLKPVLDPLAEEFTKQTGIEVEYSYLCSAMVLTNMQLTRTGDILIPGSQHYMDLAIEKDVIDPDTVGLAGYMIPVIAVQEGNPKNITCLEDLAKPGLEIGVGEPDALAVGRLTVEMLNKIELYDSVMENVVLTGGSATKLLLPVAMKNLDAVINWMAVAMLFEKQVDLIKIDPKKLMYSVAPIGITKYSKKKEWAKKYIDFVASDNGREFFYKHGFEPYFDVNEIEKVR